MLSKFLMRKNIKMVNKIANNIGINFLQKSDMLSNFDIITPLVVLVNFLWGIRSDDRGIDSIPPTPLLNLSCVLCTTCPKSIYHLGDNV